MAKLFSEVSIFFKFIFVEFETVVHMKKFLRIIQKVCKHPKMINFPSYFAADKLLT